MTGLVSAREERLAAAPTEVVGRLDFLDGIRAAAALFVVVHHGWLAVYRSYPDNTGPGWLEWMIYGHLAVSVFIVVSGFSLSIVPASQGWRLRSGSRTFLSRRAWRIVPTYWAALAFSCLVFGVITPDETGDVVSAKAIVVHALLLQDVVDSPKPNGAFWSIAVEWQIYFLFPLLLLLLRRRVGPARLLALVSAAVVGGYLLATHTDLFARFLNITPQYIVLFVMGMVGAGVVGGARRPWQRHLVLVAAALGVAVVAICATFGPRRMTEQFFWLDLLVGAATATAIAGLCVGGGPMLRRMLACRPAVRVGAFSYSIYLVHAPLLWLVWHFGASHWDLPRELQLLAYLAVSLPVVLACSYVFYLAVEKVFLERRSWAAWRDWALRRRPAPVPS